MPPEFKFDDPPESEGIAKSLIAMIPGVRNLNITPTPEDQTGLPPEKTRVLSDELAVRVNSIVGKLGDNIQFYPYAWGQEWETFFQGLMPRERSQLTAIINAARREYIGSLAYANLGINTLGDLRSLNVRKLADGRLIGIARAIFLKNAFKKLETDQSVQG